MIIIGLLLLIVAAIVGLDIGWKNTFQVPDVVLFGQSLGITVPACSSSPGSLWVRS